MGDEIRGRWTVVRPLNDGDLGFVCRMFRDPEQLALWQEDSRILPEGMIRERLLGDLGRRYHSFFVFAPASAPREPMGLFYTYQYSPANGTLFVTMATDPARYSLGCAGEAGLMIYRWLFSAHPLRKVYANVFEFNRESLAFCRSCGFVEEGFMREHVFHGGRWWGMYTLALYRDAFERIDARFRGGAL